MNSEKQNYDEYVEKNGAHVKEALVSYEQRGSRILDELRNMGETLQDRTPTWLVKMAYIQGYIQGKKQVGGLNE